MALSYIVLRGAAGCCGVLRGAAGCCGVLRDAAGCCMALNGLAWCCKILQNVVAGCFKVLWLSNWDIIIHHNGDDGKKGAL